MKSITQEQITQNEWRTKPIYIHHHVVMQKNINIIFVSALHNLILTDLKRKKKKPERVFQEKKKLCWYSNVV